MDNFEELKEFLETIEPDDYEMRVDALAFAIQQVAPHTYYDGAVTVLATARKFYAFLKEG